MRTLGILKGIGVQTRHGVMRQRLRHEMIVLLIVVGRLGIGSFAIDRLAGDGVTRLFQYFFGALFVFEKNKTEWATLLLRLVDRCFDLSNLDMHKFRESWERQTAIELTVPN